MKRFAATATIARPPETVWSYAADIARHADWMSVTDVRALEGDGSAVGSRGRARMIFGPFTWDTEFVVAEAERGRHILWRSIDPRADMEFALAANAVLAGASLEAADMSGAILDASVLTGADLRAVNLRGAGLRAARLDGADLRGARLGGAFLVDASLRGADLRGAYLRLAKLEGANLSGANLSDAEGLTQAQLAAAQCDSETKMPAALSEADDGEG